MIIIAGRKKNLPQRYFAGLIDYSIVLSLTVLYIYVMGEGDEYGTYRVTGFRAFLIPVFWFIYFPLCEGSGGQTLGKKAFNLYVVDLNGERPSILHAFIRRMLDILEIIFMGMPGLLMVNHSDKNQRLGDMMAGTTVVRTDSTCLHCGTHLELSPREVMLDKFTCPKCNQANCGR